MGKPSVLFLGNVDYLTQQIMSALKMRAVNIFKVDEKSIFEISKASYSNERLYMKFSSSSSIDFNNITGILTNFFKANTPNTFDTSSREESEIICEDQERYWSEWTSFFASGLSIHNNVINKPFSGSWCGLQPTIFHQLECLNRGDFPWLTKLSLDELISYFEKDTRQLYKGIDFPLCLLLPNTDNAVRQNAKEIRCILIDDTFFYSCNTNSLDKKNLLAIAKHFQSYFNTRMLEISLIFKIEYHFRYFIIRPQLRNFDWRTKLAVIIHLADKLCNPC